MKRIRLRTKFLFLFTIISLIPLFITLTLTYTRFQNTLEHDSIKLENQLAETASNKIKTFIISQIGILNTITTLYDQEFATRQAASEKLVENLLYRSENFTDISILDKNGKEIIRQDRVLVVLPDDLRDLHDTDPFKTVKSKGLYIGPMYVKDGRPLFDIGRWIVDSQGNFMGAVFAQVNAQIMPEVMANISKIAGPGGRVFIVNEKGIVVAHPDLSYILDEKDLSTLPVIKSIVKKGPDVEVSKKYKNENGQDVLGSAFPIILESSDIKLPEPFKTNWFVIVEQEQSVVFSEAYKVILFFLFVSITVLGLTIAVSIFFSGKISAPIELLHKATVEFGKGNLNYRTEVNTDDEIGDLAKNFDEMSSKISNSIGELKTEEKIMSAERDKLSVILSGITNAVIAVDLNKNIILFNKAAETITGETARSVIGKPLGSLFKLYDIDKELSEGTYCPIKDKNHGRRVVFNKKSLRLVNKHGQEFYVNLICSTIDEKSTIQLGCILTFQDITHELEVEKMKGEFVTITAHQLRTPLTGLKWSLDYLTSDSTGPLNTEQRQILDKVSAATNQIISLVNDLLNVSQMEEGRFGIALKKSSIIPVLKNIEDSFKKTVGKKNITLKILPIPKLLPVTIDEDKIQMAIQNIIDNAVRYSFPGGQIELKVEQRPKDIVISVKDSGIGITPSESERVFSKFFRSSRALLHHTDGTGLGLYVSKNIIEGHKGKLWFDSKENEGTTFYISLPINS